MGLVETEALVLRSYNLAEADKIVVCLTRKSGVVRAVARGARRLKSRFGASLEPFTLLALTFHEKEGRELVTLRDAEIVRSYFNLSAQAETLSALSYMSELLLEFAPPHEPNEKLFRMATACIEALAQSSPAKTQAVTRYFEIWLLKLAGFLPNMRICSDCQRGLSGQEKIFLNAESRPRCLACSNGQGMQLGAESHAQLQATQRLSPLDFADSASHETMDGQGQIAQLTRRLIERILERELRAAASLN